MKLTFSAFLLALPLMFAFPNHAFADPGDDAKGSVKGQIVDKGSGEPLEYATVSVYALPDSNLVNGAVTDPSGVFSIELEDGRYYLDITFISYERLRTPSFEIGAGNRRVDLGKMGLSSNSQTLQEIEVRAEKSRMQMSLDKRVFNVGKDLANLGGSASDILDNVPSVTVDAEGAVSLRGSGGVRILIDGRPSGLVGGSDNNGLRQIPANLIDRIEVITNPAARYEAEGMSGIINIILKKDKRSGFNGAIDVNAGYPNNHGLSVNTNYRTGNWNFFGNYGISYRERPSDGSLYQEVYRRNPNGPDTTFIQRQLQDRTRQNLGNTLRLGTDYSFSETSSLTASFIYKWEDNQNISNLTYRDFLFSLENPTGITTRIDEEDETENNYEYALAYRKDFEGDGHQLTVDARYQDNSELEVSSIREAYYTPEFTQTGEPELRQRSSNLEERQQTILQADYVRPFSEAGKIEVGLRAAFRQIRTDFSVDNLEDGEWVPFAQFTNEFLFNEDVYAAYSSFGNKYGNWSLQAGLRAEYTDMLTELLITDEVNPRDYMNLFPSLFVGYELPNGNSVQASYSRRINRPNFWSLNPFFNFSDARNIRTGNPNLNPEFTDAYEVNYLKYWDDASLTAGVFYRHTEGVVQRIRSIDEQGVTLTRPENLAVEDAYGLDVTFSYSIAKWWDIDGNVNFFRSLISGEFEGNDLSADALTWFGRATSRMTVFKTLETQLRANYRAPRITPQGRNRSLYSFDLTLSKDILDKKGTLTFSVNDVLNSRRWRYLVEDTGFFSEGDFQWRPRQFTLAFSYRFNQQERRERGERGDYGGDGGGEF